MPKFIFAPRDIDNFPNNLVKLSGETFNFEEAYTLTNGDEYYQPVDIKFPSSTPVNILDLENQNG